MLAAQGGKGSTTSQYGICYNDAVKCNGAEVGAPSGGNSGLSGPDPLAMPGVANLTKGMIILDQLPSVDSLLPYYDQVQLDMVRYSLAGLSHCMHEASKYRCYGIDSCRLLVAGLS